MSRGISRREKVLVVLAIIAVIGYIGANFLVLPLYNDYTAKQEELLLLTSQKMEIDAKLSVEDSIRTGNENARAEYEDIRSRYPEAISSFEVDQILTSLCNQNNLYPIMLGISDPRVYTIKQSDDPGTPEIETGFSTVTANMNLSGTYEALKSLLDTVETIESIRITRAAFSGYSETAQSTGTPNISVAFEITMLNKFNMDS